jgi:hypothetical protein
VANVYHPWDTGHHGEDVNVLHLISLGILPNIYGAPAGLSPVAGRGYLNSASGQQFITTQGPGAAAPVLVEPAKPPPEAQSWVTWGKVIPISLGLRRISPQLIWLKAPVLIGVTATADFAVSWGYNADVNKSGTRCTALYANGTLIWTIGRGKILPGSWSWTFYPGTESQGQDPTMVADKGAANTPAYRNQMYGVFRNFPLQKFGFKLPGISAEIAWDEGEAPRSDSWNPADKDANVVLETAFTLKKPTITSFTGAEAFASSVRSRTYHRRGQYYLEIKLDNYDDAWRPRMIFYDWTTVGVGVALGDARLTVGAGNDATGVGAAMPMAGPLTRADIGTPSNYASVPGSPWVEGETIGFHVNMNAGYARARIVSRGGAWSAPVYYTGPSHIGAPPIINLGDPLYVMGTVSVPAYAALGSTADKQTVNFGASPFIGAIPDGATAWNGDGNTGVTGGDLPLQVFIEQIAKYVALDPATDLEFISIDDKIHGGLITEDTVFRDFLAVLGRAYGFDFVESDKIRIVKRVVAATYTVDKIIPREDMLTESDRALTTIRRKDDAPSEIELKYIDVTQQFRWNLQKARRVLFPVRTTNSDRKDSFSIPVITTANLALTSAGRALYREAMQNVDHKGSLLTKHLDLEPADIIEITVGDTQYTVKIAELSFAEDMRVSIRVINLLTDEDMEFTAEAGEPSLPYSPIASYLAATEGPDEASFSQFVANLFAAEGADTFAGDQRVLVLAATDRPDTFTGAQFLSDLAATDRPDGFAGVGGWTSTLTATDRPDVLAGEGGFTATLAATDRPDTFAGEARWAGTLTATDRPDTFAGVSTAGAAALAATDRPDTFAGAGGWTSALAATDRPDVLAATIDLTQVLDLDFTRM